MKPRIALVGFALALLLPLGAAAATRTWTNSAGGNWSVAGNWDGGVSVPSNGDALVFPAFGGSYFMQNDLPNTTYDSFTFQSGIQTQVNGNAVTLTSSNPLRVFGAMTLGMPLTFSAPGTV